MSLPDPMIIEGIESEDGSEALQETSSIEGIRG